MMRRCLGKLRAFLIVGFSAAYLFPPSALGDPIYRWEVSQHKNRVLVSDCRQCEEQRALWLECRTGAGKAFISLPGAAMERGRKGQRVRIIIEIDGWRQTRRARLDYQGLIGYLPEFRLSIHDPLFEKMAAGQSMTIRVKKRARFGRGAQKASIHLNGSRAALTRFHALCNG